MNKILKTWCSIGLISCGFVTLTSFDRKTNEDQIIRFPYKGKLSERQAAEHLLERFTYGARPGEVDSVLKLGLENWFSQQLAANLPEDSLNQHLNIYDSTLNLSNSEVCRIYPPGFVVRSMAIKDSVISKDSVDRAVDKKAFNAQIQAYMDKKGLKLDQDLYKQFIDQNILRAIYSRNQLQEVLTDFWFNHFNVSFFKGECAQFIPAYERDVIRPNVLGKFDQMLIASAQSAAMLYYLDNFSSVGPPNVIQSKAPVRPVLPNATDTSMMMNEGNVSESKNKIKTITQPGKNVNGLNENYAREVMELHTLGVDGGYTQQDVTQAAKVLTGWTVYPISDMAYGSAMKGLVAKVGEDNLVKKGYVHKGDFLFTPNRHDQSEKIVLGRHFPASTDPATGYQEGIDLLEMFAHQPSTAKFICRKLAVRFVSDNPPQSLINKMARSFTEHDGDIRQVLISMVNSEEFWSKKVILSKTKSPFELAISAVRKLNATVKDPYPLYNWIARMGEKRYYYQAPTGFPDRGTYWINTGALLNRMDFSLALTSSQINSIKLNLSSLSTDSSTAKMILITWSKLLTPDVNPEQMLTQLAPILNDSVLMAKVNSAIVKQATTEPEKPVAGAPGDMMLMGVGNDVALNKTTPAAKDVEKTDGTFIKRSKPSNTIALVAGLIIGSPAFQKR
jgi:uncharacterized protein (DUF1800 family)